MARPAGVFSNEAVVFFYTFFFIKKQKQHGGCDNFVSIVVNHLKGSRYGAKRTRE